MRAVQTLATQQTADLAGLGATVGFLEDPQTVFGAEPPPGRLGHKTPDRAPGALRRRLLSRLEACLAAKETILE